MNYIKKAFIQNLLALLPDYIGKKIYYQIQRKFGSLRTTNHSKRLLISNTIFNLAEIQNINPKNKKFLEIGTGRNIMLPLGLWLKGAKEVTTVDINKYFDKKLFLDSLNWIIENKKFIIDKIKDIEINRIEEIENFTSLENKNIDKFLENININYLAPCDAANLPIRDNYFDFHISFTVLEHIKLNILEKIFRESKRVIKDNGYLIHLVDYTDHFSHSDPNLTKISFLSYSKIKRNLLINNKFMYMNLLRHDDFISFFKKNSFELIQAIPEIDNHLLKELNKNKKSFKLIKKFSKKSNNILATDSSWFILRKTTFS